MSHGKVIIINLIVGLTKMISLYKTSCFPELHTQSKSKKQVELIFSNYATKSDIENASGVDTSEFAKKANLACLISNIDKLDIDKLEQVTTCLYSLKSKIDKLDVDKLIPVLDELKHLSNVVEKKAGGKTAYGELIETTDTSDLVKKEEYNTKSSETKKNDHDFCHKYITTQLFIKSTSENPTVRLAQAKLATKEDIVDFVKRHILMKT